MQYDKYISQRYDIMAVMTLLGDRNFQLHYNLIGPESYTVCGPLLTENRYMWHIYTWLANEQTLNATFLHFS